MADRRRAAGLGRARGEPGSQASLWPLWFGLFAGTTGALVAKLQAEGKPAPTTAGWALLVTGISGGILMPFSGFWAGIPLGLLILVPERREPRVMG